MDTKEIIDSLKANEFFKNLSQEQLQKLAASLRILNVNAGATIITEGQPADSFFVIHEGQVEVLKEDSTNTNHRLSYLESQDIFGEFALLENTSRSATIRATQQTILLAISANEFKKILAESQLSEQIFQNLSEKLSDKLKFTNEIAAHALERELQQEKLRVAMGRFLIYMLSILCLYSFVLSSVTKLMGEASATTIVTLPLLLVLIVFSIIAMKWVGFPMSFYGFTLNNWKPAVLEALLVTVPILLFILLLKWVLINFVPIYAHTPLFNPYSSIKHFQITAISPFTFWLLLILLYSIHSPLQEMIVRGFLQSTLQEFLTGKYSCVSAIIISNVIFSTFHLVHSFMFAIATFFPGLVWGWLYSRHKTLIGVSISHILIGVWAAFVIGFSVHSY